MDNPDRKLFPNITVGKIRRDMYVDTVHNEMLEFVLSRASERTGVDYYEALAGMLSASDVFHLMGYGAYGVVHVTIEVNSINDLPEAAEEVNKIVGYWLKRFNINRMKKHV